MGRHASRRIARLGHDEGREFLLHDFGDGACEAQAGCCLRLPFARSRGQVDENDLRPEKLPFPGLFIRCGEQQVHVPHE